MKFFTKTRSTLEIVVFVNQNNKIFQIRSQVWKLIIQSKK